jgi:hypothetical protein
MRKTQFERTTLIDGLQGIRTTKFISMVARKKISIAHIEMESMVRFTTNFSKLH